jgi:hypothetical protein
MLVSPTIKKTFTGNRPLKGTRKNPHYFRVHSYIIIPEKDTETKFKVGQNIFFERDGGDEFKVYLENKPEQSEIWVSKRPIN